MNGLDSLRWRWAAHRCDDLLGWCGVFTTSDTQVSDDIRLPLSAALRVAMTARMVVDGVSADDIVAAIEESSSLDGSYVPSEEIHSLVRAALTERPWPSGLPSSPRDAEFMFLEMWAAAHGRAKSAPAVHRELSQQWGVRHPGVLTALCQLDPYPFESYADVYTWLLDQEEQGVQDILLHLHYQAGNRLEERLQNPLDVADGRAPAHLERVAADLLMALQMEDMLKRSERVNTDPDATLQSSIAGARESLSSFRAQLVDAMAQLTAHEVELVQNAIFGAEGADAPAPDADSSPQDAPVPPQTLGQASGQLAAKRSPAQRRAESPTLDDVSLAVRLRRLWTDDLVPWLLALANDLADPWQETALRRSGLTLEVLSPVNFGSGDPLRDIEDEFLERLVDATDGHADRVRISFLGNARYKAPRRGRTTDRDVFDPGDPGHEARPIFAHALAKRFARGTSPDVEELVSRLRVSAVSSHRLWLVAPDRDTVSAVGTTPGAAFALRESVRLVQSVRQDPLYALHADRNIWAVSDPIPLPH